MPPPRPILFAATDSAWAGAQQQMLELALGLDRARWEPLLVTSGTGGLVPRARAAGVRTFVVPFGLVRRKFPFAEYYLGRPFLLGALLRREQVALVHAHDANSPIAFAPIAARLGVPVISHIHDLDQRWVTRRSVAAMSKARSVVVGISDAAVRWAAERGAPADGMRRVYNGVHLPDIAPGTRERVRGELDLRDGEVAVALVGRLVPRKGQEDAIRALAEPALALSPMRLILIGGAAAPERDYERGLHALVAQLGLGERVTFLGERDDATRLLAGMDLSLVPSRREAFGRVVIEGMHAGTPVVAYHDGALPELVRDGTDGLVVPAGDVRALAAALACLAGDANLRVRMSASARTRAREFSHARWVGEVSALYEELLNGNQ